MLTNDQTQSQEWTGPCFGKRRSSGLIDNLSRDSVLESQFGAAFANHHDFTPTASAASSAKANVPLAKYIREARRAIGLLIEAEQRAEMNNRHQEAMSWLAENRKFYAGQWIALQGSELLAAGKNAREVYTLVRRHEPTPLVVKIESEELPFGGW